jgi:hypothetical protein
VLAQYNIGSVRVLIFNQWLIPGKGKIENLINSALLNCFSLNFTVNVENG